MSQVLAQSLVIQPPKICTCDTILIPVPAPCCQGSSLMVCPFLEKIFQEPREPIVEGLDALLREAYEGRARDL